MVREMEVKIMEAKTSKDLELDINNFLLMIAEDIVVNIKITYVNHLWIALVIYKEDKSDD